MKRFFSHLPAWVEASACGIWRASANIMAMACSAVVIELPKGVFITITPLRGGGRDVDVVDADAGAADHLEGLGAREDLRRDLGGRADGEAVVVADDRGELVLVLAELGLEIDLDAAILEDLDGGGRKVVGDEHAGSGHWCILQDASSGRRERRAAMDAADGEAARVDRSEAADRPGSRRR